MKADFPKQQAVTHHAYNLLMKSLAIIFRDIHKGSYYQSSDARYYESLLTDTKFFENFNGYIIESSHIGLNTDSLLNALNYAKLLCNPEQKTIPNNVEPNRLIQEHIWDPIWNFHYAMMSPLREKNSVHEKKSIPKPLELSELPKPLELSKLPDELVKKHILSFWGWQHQLSAVKQCSQKLKSLCEDSSLKVPYSTLNYQQRLKEYIIKYFAKNTPERTNCFTLLSEHSFLAGEGKALCWYDFRNPTKSFFGNLYPKFTKLEGHDGDLTSICIWPPHKAVSGSKDKTLRIWDLREGQCLKTLQRGHTAEINCVIMFNERMILSAAADKKLISWDLENESFEIITETETEIFNMLKLDDNRIVYATADGLAIFGLKDKQWIKINSVDWKERQGIDSICLTSLGTLLVSSREIGDRSFSIFATGKHIVNVVKVFDINENCLKEVHTIRHNKEKFRFARY